MTDTNLLQNFQCTKELPIPELRCTLVEMVHQPTQAKIIHIQTDDPENVFCLSFQTFPDSSDGIAHILEHTVLCGSKRYPIKDPFMSMARRSLNTFMNAFTGNDFTCYPASSQISKDFYNLLDVYLDAVFSPLLNNLSFLQEGIRLEFANLEDSTTPLEYKGIVYNEMKAHLSLPEARMEDALLESLFPNHLYSYNSGGTPQDIPNLTYEKLIQFHQKFYHPGRCIFYFYGNMPLKNHLEFLQQKVLQHFGKIPPLQKIAKIKPLKTPIRKTIYYPISEENVANQQTYVSMGWLTCDLKNQKDLLSLQLLEILLMDTDASPLKKAILQSGLCQQASSAFYDHMSEIPFFIHLRGCKEKDLNKIENFIFQTLKSIAKKSFSKEIIENALYQFEFYRSEISTDGYPFGLTLFFRSILLAQHQGQAEDGLQIHQLIKQIRQCLKEDKNYFSKLLEKHLINNPHFSIISLMPNLQLAKEEEQKEKMTLQEIKQKLTPSEKDRIIKTSKELAKFQVEQENISTEVLPKLKIEDIPKNVQDYPLDIVHHKGITLFHHSCFTNDIVYIDYAFELPYLEEEEQFYLSLFTTFFPQLGTKNKNWIEMQKIIQGNIGNIGTELIVNLPIQPHSLSYPFFMIRTKTLRDKVSNLLQIMQELLLEVDLTDTERLKNLLLKHHASLESSLNSNAIHYAITSSSNGLDISSRLTNLWSGYEYFSFIRELATNIESKLIPIQEKLIDIKNKILNINKPHIIFSCEKETFAQILQDHAFSAFTEKTFPKWKNDYPLKPTLTHCTHIASPVAFTATTVKTCPYLDKFAPVLGVLARLLTHKKLHILIREQGGAYGGGSAANWLTGHFTFYSYADPCLVKTIHAFQDSIQSIIEGNFSDEDIYEAKLEVIQTIDAPLPPGNRAYTAYQWWKMGRTYEIRQNFRKQVLDTTKEQLIQAATQFLYHKVPNAPIVTFTGKEMLEKENEKLILEGKHPIPLKQI